MSMREFNLKSLAQLRKTLFYFQNMVFLNVFQLANQMKSTVLMAAMEYN